jgi:hypothetical protein
MTPRPILLSLLTLGTALATDWPQVGGPRGGYAVADPAVTEDWTRAAPKVAWRHKLTGTGGPGQVVIADGLVHAVDQNEQDDEAILRVIGLDDGQERWHFRWTTPAGTQTESDKRPFGSPAVAGGRVYVIGPAGYRDPASVRAIDLKTRTQAWVVEPAQDGLTLHANASPHVVDDLVLSTVKEGEKDALLALDRATGARRWKTVLPFVSGGSGVMQNAPQVATFDGLRQIVVHHPNGLSGVGLDGALLWTNSGYQRKTLTATPSVAPDGHVYVSSGHEGSCALFRVARANGAWTCTTVFADGLKLKGEVQNGYDLPHLIYGNWNVVSASWWNGHFFAVGTKGLHCLRPDGSIAWTSGEPPPKPGWNPATSVVNGYVVTFAGGKKRGVLLIAKADPARFIRIAEVPIHNATPNTQLAYAAGRIVSRCADDGEIVCVDLGLTRNGGAPE